MITTDTNFYVMQCWEIAYQTAGEACLPTFGLSETDIDAVLLADQATRRRWAMLPVSFVLPRPGLLPALRSGRVARIQGIVARGRSRSPMLARLPQPLNQHLLAVWQQAASKAELSAELGLEDGDAVALRDSDHRALASWSTVPVALATPKPGLLPNLYREHDPQLLAFIDSLGR